MDCSGSFGVKYEIFAPRSIEVSELAAIRELVARTAGVEPDKVRAERHDPCLMDEDDPEAEWVLGTITQFVAPSDSLEMNAANRICQALYKHFKQGRTVRLTNPGGTECCVLYTPQ